MIADIIKEAFAQSSVLEWIVAISAGALWLVKLGERRRARRNADVNGESSLSVVEARLKLAIVEAERSAKHAAVNEAAVLVSKLSTRIDRAGEKASELASRVQGLPTQKDLSAIWIEVTRLREQHDEITRQLSERGERIARLEAGQDRRQ